MGAIWYLQHQQLQHQDAPQDWTVRAKKEDLVTNRNPMSKLKENKIYERKVLVNSTPAANEHNSQLTIFSWKGAESNITLVVAFQLIWNMTLSGSLCFSHPHIVTLVNFQFQKYSVTLIWYCIKFREVCYSFHDLKGWAAQ